MVDVLVFARSNCNMFCYSLPAIVHHESHMVWYKMVSNIVEENYIDIGYYRNSLQSNCR